MALRDAQLGSRATKAIALRLERGGARAELIIIMREQLREVLVLREVVQNDFEGPHVAAIPAVQARRGARLSAGAASSRLPRDTRRLPCARRAKHKQRGPSQARAPYLAAGSNISK